MSPLYGFQATTLEGQPYPLADLRGRVLLVVNTASACGFTPQLAGLQALHERYAGRGLVVLAFPCNQFGGQEPGNAAEIGAFCRHRYSVGFPVMSKVAVKGPGAHPLFAWLTEQAPGLLGSKAIKWNFTKFLIGRQGQVLGRYAPQTRPEALVADIDAALAA